nr:zinc finger protein JAGGED-like isoform X3 [Arachis hypogaea]
MNRHRQERETETLNHARQLVFRNDHHQPPPHLGYVCHFHYFLLPLLNSSFEFRCCQDPTLRFPRYFSASSTSSTAAASHHQPYLYASPSRPPPVSFPGAPHDYYVDHVLSTAESSAGAGGGSYTCIGAPVVGQAGKEREQEGSLNWGRSSSTSGSQPHHRLDPPSAINRFQDGF